MYKTIFFKKNRGKYCISNLSLLLKFILPRNFTRENPLLIYCCTLVQGLKRE